MLPTDDFPGTAIAQQWMVAHEVGHNIGAEHEWGDPSPVCWLQPRECGSSIMIQWFDNSLKFFYQDNRGKEIAKAVQHRLGSHSD